MSARGTHAPNFVDREGATYGHFTVIACLGKDHARRSVWSCRCICGRPDCAGVVERTSAQLARGDRAACRRRTRPARPVPVATLLPEGVKAPWSRPADMRADRDARLSRAFAEADLR